MTLIISVRIANQYNKRKDIRISMVLVCYFDPPDNSSIHLVGGSRIYERTGEKYNNQKKIKDKVSMYIHFFWEKNSPSGNGLLSSVIV